jgi:SAM-dependent methyltransferase
MVSTRRIKRCLPEPVKKALRPLRCLVIRKETAELWYWRERLEIDGGVFKNDHYRRIMLGIAGEQDETFLQGKVVADFGCGPRGSLTWAECAALRIGIDVLADRYADEFTSNFLSHKMVYLKSTESVIPLPSCSVDVLFTLNAVDHVKDLPVMCREILRILRPEGELMASFNLGEPATIYEPQQLTERLIRDSLLKDLDVLSYRTARVGPEDDPYRLLLDGTYGVAQDEVGFLWVRAKKRNGEQLPE